MVKLGVGLSHVATIHGAETSTQPSETGGWLFEKTFRKTKSKNRDEMEEGIFQPPKYRNKIKPSISLYLNSPFKSLQLSIFP